MNIPLVPIDNILHIERLPMMPLIPLILLKLQAWEDHRNALRPYLQDKQHTDAADLARLLPIAIRRGDSLRKESWMPETFVIAAKQRIQRYLLHSLLRLGSGTRLG